MEYSGAGGKLIHEKNQKQKISWHSPFKDWVPGFATICVLCICVFVSKNLESLTRDFQLQVFFSVSPSPLSIPIGPFQFFWTFAEIFANERLWAASTTPAIKEKILKVYSFFRFFKELRWVHFTLLIEYIAGINDTGDHWKSKSVTCLSPVSLTPVIIIYTGITGDTDSWK